MKIVRKAQLFSFCGYPRMAAKMVLDRTVCIGQHKLSLLSILSYAVDWTIYTVILVFGMTYGASIPPRETEFSPQNISLMYTYKNEAYTLVPLPLLLAVGVGVPMATLVVLAVLAPAETGWKRRLWDLHIGLLALSGAMAIQLVVTCTLKNVCGLPRPDFLSRCKVNPAVSVVGLADTSICLTDNTRLLHEGFRSFPSGHSAMIFCAMVMTSLNVAAKTHVWDQRGVSFKLIWALAPIIGAMLVACSRVSDNRHFLRDVTAGLLIGTVAAVFVYCCYFPWVSNTRNFGRAYPPRRLGIANWFNTVGGFWKLEDRFPGAYCERTLDDERFLDVLSNIKRIEKPDVRDMERHLTWINGLGERANDYHDLKSSKVE